MKKVVLFAVILAVFLSTVLVFQLIQIPQVENILDGMGNTTGNIHNDGHVTEDEDYYYSSYTDNDIIYRESKHSKKTEKILEGKMGFTELNVCGNYLYFVDGAPGFLKRVSLDGKSRQKMITFQRVGNVMLSDGKIYYRLSDFNDDWGKVYSCNLDGREKKFLVKEIVKFYIDGPFLYYINAADGNSLWEMSTSGENKRKINSGNIFDVVFDEKNIYYTDRDSFNLFVMNKETMEEYCINEDRCENINLFGDWIYYRNMSDKGSLYRISTDGIIKEKLADGNLGMINVVSGSVFFERVDMNVGKYRLYIDDMHEEKLA